MLDHKTGRSRGFGFVTFDSEEAVENIFVEGKMHELGGKKVSQRRYLKILIGISVQYNFQNDRLFNNVCTVM